MDTGAQKAAVRGRGEEKTGDSKKAGQILIMILGSRFIQRKRLPFIY